MQVIDHHANSCIREPSRGWPERWRTRETKHGCNQPTNTSGDQQGKSYEKEICWLSSAQLLEEQEKGDRHLSRGSPSKCKGHKRQAPLAHVSRVRICAQTASKMV